MVKTSRTLGQLLDDRRATKQHFEYLNTQIKHVCETTLKDLGPLECWTPRYEQGRAYLREITARYCIFELQVFHPVHEAWMSYGNPGQPIKIIRPDRRATTTRQGCTSSPTITTFMFEDQDYIDLFECALASEVD